MIGCNGGEPGPPPVGTVGHPTSGTDTAGASSSTGPAPVDHCALSPEMGDEGSGSESDGGFKFDVGAPDGELLFGIDCDDVAANPSNLGCEFWAVDLPNDDQGTDMSPPAADAPFAIVVANVSSLGPAMVNVYEGDSDEARASAVLDPGDAQTIPLPALSISTRESTVDGVAYRVHSDVPIVAYQFNPLDNVDPVYSNDASLLLPTSALGDDYTAVTGDGVILGMSPDDPTPVPAGAFVSVVATQDGTDVTVLASTMVVAEPPSPVTLDRGEVLTIVSDIDFGDANLSGTRIMASERVAVFAGNVATAVPNGQGFCCADHLESQLPPHEAWDSSYAVAPPPTQGADADRSAVYRITGAFDGTQLLYCPQPPVGAPLEIGAGETVTFQTDAPFTVQSADPARAFSVAQFLLSNDATESDAGDPGLLVLPGFAQWQHRIIFVIPEGYAGDYVTIVDAGDGIVRLDGQSIETEFSRVGVLAGRTFRYAHVPVSPGKHAVESSAPVYVGVFGYDDAVSYGFPGGSGVRVVSVPPAAG